MKCTTKVLVAFAGGIAMISTAAVASPTAAETASGDTAAKQKSSVVSKPFQAVDPAEPGVTTNAQRGINDICALAISIACGGSVDADLTSASTGIDESFNCAIGTGQTNTLWYSFMATDTAATIQTCNTAGATDSTLNVFSGNCGALVEIACGEDECGFLSTTTVTGLTIGATYYIQIGAWSADTIGTYTLEVDCFADLGACCDFDGNCAVTSTSDCDGYFTAGVECAEVTCASIPACPDTPTRFFEGFNGNEFLVDGVDDALNSGCNADFGTAFDDPNGTGSLLCGDIICGTSGSDLTDSSGGSVRDQDWFIYETVADVILTVELTSLFDGDIVIAPINSDPVSCPDPLTILDFAQTTSGGSASFDITLAPGTYTIWVQTTEFEGTPLNAPYFFSISCDFAVDPVGCCFDDGTCSDLLPSACLTADGTVQADLCAAVTCPIVAINNDFAGALEVNCNSTFVADLATASAGTEFAFSCGLGGNAATNTLWYSFVASDSTVTVTSCGTGNAAPADDTIIDVFEADGITEVGCSDDDCASSAFLSTVELTGLTIGNTYFIRIGAWSPGDVAAYNIALLCGDPEPEACCFNDGSCSDLLAPDCTIAGGVPQGISTSCAESPCCVACDGTEVAEGEVDCFTEYNDLFNSGCNADTGFPTTPLGANTAVCGTTGNFTTAAGESRDTDWYSYNHPGGPLTLTVQSQAFSALAGVLDVDATGSNCATGAFLVDFVGNTTGCDPLVLSGDLPAGTYILFVSTSSFSGVPCGFQYTIEAAAGPSCDPTCADATGEGDVNLDDLDAVLGSFGTSVPVGTSGDVNCDGTVNLDDLDLVLGQFGTPCP